MHGRHQESRARWEHRGRLTTILSVVPALLFLFSVGRAGDPGDAGTGQRQQAAGWLQLEQDQKTFREAVEPLNPRAAQSLDRLERSQRTRARDAGRRQRRATDLDRNLQRGTKVERPVSVPNDLESRRQIERQRLEMRIQRETLLPSRP